MNKIYRMDIYRLIHSRVLYISIAFITIMAFALPRSGMSTTMEGLLGVVGGSSGGDFMTSAMGVGVINILLGIILSIFVSGDYSGGFVKNIFTTHAKPKDYIGGKMMALAAASSMLLVIYILEAVVSLMIFTGSVTMSGSIFGLIIFLFEKWLISLALSAVVMFVLLFTRNMAWGIMAGFLIATGGLTMGVQLLANWLNWSWMNTIFSITISGASSLCTLFFNPLSFLRILIAAAVWVIIACIAGSKVIEKKDI